MRVVNGDHAMSIVRESQPNPDDFSGHPQRTVSAKRWRSRVIDLMGFIVPFCKDSRQLEARVS
jgi:hypothetical protein